MRNSISKIKIMGGKSMKKNLRNNKGFTLIELLIVIAILAILAAITITMFTGAINRSRTTADETMANNIKRAIATYIAESGDTTATGLGAAVDTAIERLQGNTISFDGKTYGPYLENVDGGSASAADYDPQGNTMNGWDIDVDATGNVSVQAATGDSWN